MRFVLMITLTLLSASAVAAVATPPCYAVKGGKKVIVPCSTDPAPLGTVQQSQVVVVPSVKVVPLVNAPVQLPAGVCTTGLIKMCQEERARMIREAQERSR